jgi:hypothetical protein
VGQDQHTVTHTLPFAIEFHVSECLSQTLEYVGLDPATMMRSFQGFSGTGEGELLGLN